MPGSQPWFERRFSFDLPLSRLPDVLERLRGTPARIEERAASFEPSTATVRWNGSWSIQENIGHLADLEPIWIRRAGQVLEGQPELAVADLANRATDEAGHNSVPLGEILGRFRGLRTRLVSILEKADGPALQRTARHPRLGTPMRLIDIAFFVAEHDDHHLARITGLLELLAPGKSPA
jgi:uncharacterized damage-inducible protein DinB